MFTLVEVVALLKAYGYFLVFPIAFFEGPITAVICGWLAGIGIFNFFIVYFILILANIVPDSLLYALGYYGGPPVIKKWGHWFHLDLEKTIKLKNHFDNHGGKILLTVKVIPHFATTPLLVGAGLAKYSFWLFLRYSLTIELIKTAVLLLVGYFIGDAYQRIVVYLDFVGGAISILLVVVLVIGLCYWLKKKRKCV